MGACAPKTLLQATAKIPGAERSWRKFFEEQIKLLAQLFGGRKAPETALQRLKSAVVLNLHTNVAVVKLIQGHFRSVCAQSSDGKDFSAQGWRLSL